MAFTSSVQQAIKEARRVSRAHGAGLITMADRRTWDRQIRDEHGDQLLAVRRQAAERLAQRRVALGCEQFLVGRAGLPTS
jgi:hypothetical protein